MVILKRDSGGDIAAAAAELSASNDRFDKMFRAFAEKPPAPVILLAEYRHRTFMKGQTAMMTETEATARLAKGLASGEYDNWTPDDFHKVIEELARDHARPGESEAQSYPRMITSHPAGQLLYKAYRETALGGTLTPEAPSETREDLIAKQAELDGENNARLHSAAVSLQRESRG